MHPSVTPLRPELSRERGFAARDREVPATPPVAPGARPASGGRTSAEAASADQAGAASFAVELERATRERGSGRASGAPGAERPKGGCGRAVERGGAERRGADEAERVLGAPEAADLGLAPPRPDGGAELELLATAPRGLPSSELLATTLAARGLSLPELLTPAARLVEWLAALPPGAPPELGEAAPGAHLPAVPASPLADPELEAGGPALAAGPEDGLELSTPVAEPPIEAEVSVRPALQGAEEPVGAPEEPASEGDGAVMEASGSGSTSAGEDGASEGERRAPEPTVEPRGAAAPFSPQSDAPAPEAAASPSARAARHLLEQATEALARRQMSGARLSLALPVEDGSTVRLVITARPEGGHQVALVAASQRAKSELEAARREIEESLAELPLRVTDLSFRVEETSSRGPAHLSGLDASPAPRGLQR